MRRGAGGFTLVELAVVMAIVALLLGGLMFTLSAQIEQRSFEETRRRIEQAREMLLSYAAVKGRLPCPARYTSSASHSNGYESFCAAGSGTCAGSETTVEQTHGNCSNFYDGYLPAATLGLTNVDDTGFALDAWNNRLRYVVSKRTTSCAVTSPDPSLLPVFTTSSTTASLKYYGVACQPNDLIVCRSSSGISATSCNAATNQIMSTSMVVAIVHATGKNGGTTDATRLDENANLDGNATFVFHTPTSSTAPYGGEFDDQMSWITIGELVGRMVASGKLP